MRYSITFHDLQGRQHTVYTNDLFTAQVVAAQLSIQFDAATLFAGTAKFTYLMGANQTTEVRV